MTPETLDLIPSERRVIDLIRRHGAISRARLSPLANVTPSTLTRVSSTLLSLCLIREGERSRDGRKGLPEQLLELNPNGAISYGLSVGYDHLHFICVDFLGTIILDHIEPLTTSDPIAVLECSRFILQKHSEQTTKYSRILGLGLALPGAFTKDRRRRLTVPGIEAWSTVDISSKFEAVTDLPFYHDNDANAAALAEALFNHDLPEEGFAYLHLTNGIGGGLVENGRVRHGHNGNAGEFGMLFPRTNHRPSAEDYALFLAEHGYGNGTVGNLAGINPPEKLVGSWVTRAGKQLAKLLDILICVMDPAQLVIGGTLPFNVRDKLADFLKTTHLTAEDNGLMRPIIQASSLHGAAALGAAALPLNSLSP